MWGRVGSLLVSAVGLIACSQNHPNGRGEPQNSVGVVNGTTVESIANSPAQHVVGLVINTTILNTENGEFESEDSQCTGTLIAEDLVLTAAHCFSGGDIVADVVFGNRMRTDDPVETRRVGTFAVHPKFSMDSDKDANDIAVLYFPGGLPMGYSPATVLTDGSVLKVDAVAQVFGYGISEPPNADDDGAGILRQANLKIVDVTSAVSEILLDSSHSTGICSGDSGGPAFIDVAGKSYLWGVTSREFTHFRKVGDDTVALCDGNSTHTNILPFKTWLADAAIGLRNAKVAATPPPHVL